jgi:uncharacterized protein YjiK
MMAFLSIAFILMIAAHAGAQDGILGRYDLAAKRVWRSSLPDQLEEISGLAATSDGRVFAHNDERGNIYEIDPKEGKIVKRFAVGEKDLKADFEGLAIAGDRFYLVTSGGEILEFLEAKNGGRALYNKYETGLTPEYDVEGLCHDPSTRSLLLACKGKAGSRYESESVKAVYAFSLATGKLEQLPRFVLDMAQFQGKLRSHDIRPSSIERHPLRGTFFLLAFQGAAIIELSKDGKVLGAANIPRSVHPQPEGLTFLPDGTMVISNEGVDEPGNIVLYPMQ